jgi:hypothetical protein
MRARNKGILTVVVLVMLALALALAGCDNPAGSDDEVDGPIDDTLDESVGPFLRISSRGEELTIGDKVVFDQLDQANGVSTETITVHNDGDEPLEFTIISISGDGGPGSHGENVTPDDAPADGVFHWESLPSTAPLAAAASRELTVRITRVANFQGPRDALLTIQSNGLVNPSRGVWLEVYNHEDIQDPGGP